MDLVTQNQAYYAAYCKANIECVEQGTEPEYESLMSRASLAGVSIDDAAADLNLLRARKEHAGTLTTAYPAAREQQAKLQAGLADLLKPILELEQRVIALRLEVEPRRAEIENEIEIVARRAQKLNADAEFLLRQTAAKPIGWDDWKSAKLPSLVKRLGNVDPNYRGNAEFTFRGTANDMPIQLPPTDDRSQTPYQPTDADLQRLTAHVA